VIYRNGELSGRHRSSAISHTRYEAGVTRALWSMIPSIVSKGAWYAIGCCTPAWLSVRSCCGDIGRAGCGRACGLPARPQSAHRRSKALFCPASCAQLQCRYLGCHDTRVSGHSLVWKRLRAGGALALFVLTFVYTPDVLADQGGKTETTISAPDGVAAGSIDRSPITINPPSAKPASTK
jgi:hypothetical protein